MTARARYQRIPGLFWSEDSLIVQMQSICFIEEYDACMSALSVALCPFFCCEVQDRWTHRPTGHTPASF